MQTSPLSDRRWLSLAVLVSLGATLSACGTFGARTGEEEMEAEEENEELFVSEQGVTCGTERWSVKTGTDADISRVNLTSTTTTIGTLVGMAAPGSLPSNNRISPVELTTYRLRNVTMTKYKLETDSDYHIVLSDGSHTLIAEIPHPGCVSTSSPLYSKISAARSAFNAKYSATTSFKTSSDTVTLTGVGFFDFNHGQTGVAPNAIELHAVTFFCSGLNC
jgi:hypothetical protein